MSDLAQTTAASIVAAIRGGHSTALAVAAATLARIAARNGEVNAFTAVTAARARAEAAAVDASLARGEDPGPLAGVPYAVKNLFDVEGEITLAGSIIERDAAAKTRDGFAVRGMRAAGGVLVGCLNMDEYAYGFTTENSHYGPSRNPHDTTRIAGGSSGGSGAAVAAGLVPITLGTDTNGSIRVPSSLNGIWGLKPTYGRLSRAGSVPFVFSLDHVGPFARCVVDLALAYEAMQGHDPDDPAQARRPADPVSALLSLDFAGLRVARLGGHFAGNGLPEVHAAADLVARMLGGSDVVTLLDAAAARSAAFLITAAEGAQQHLPDLLTRADDFEPLTRDRLLAGALVPAQWVLKAQRIRSHFRAQAAALFADWDILVAPATPSPATPIGQELLEVDGQKIPLRPSFGVFTQPISFIGLPVLAAPVQNAAGALPVGVQLIAAPWAEAKLFRAAAQLERLGICAAPVAPKFA